MKEKNKQRLFALVCVLILVVAAKCSAQLNRVNRYYNNPSITTLYPSHPMKFNTGSNDTLYVSITADSLGGKYDYRLFAYFPESKPIKGYWIEIGFTNGTVSTFEPVFVSNRHNFAEFIIDSEDLIKLRMYRFDYISFNTKRIMEPCTAIKTKDYFVRFFQML